MVRVWPDTVTIFPTFTCLCFSFKKVNAFSNLNRASYPLILKLGGFEQVNYAKLDNFEAMNIYR